jgi:hypothetical protein
VRREQHRIGDLAFVDRAARQTPGKREVDAAEHHPVEFRLGQRQHHLDIVERRNGFEIEEELGVLVVLAIDLVLRIDEFG